MNINSITTAGVATAVWSNVTRLLTADPTPYTDVNVSQSVLAGAILDLRPAAGKRRFMFGPGNGAEILQGHYDGSIFTIAGLQGSGPWAFFGIGNSVGGYSVKNTSAGSLNAVANGWERG